MQECFVDLFFHNCHGLSDYHANLIAIYNSPVNVTHCWPTTTRPATINGQMDHSAIPHNGLLGGWDFIN